MGGMKRGTAFLLASLALTAALPMSAMAVTWGDTKTAPSTRGSVQFEVYGYYTKYTSNGLPYAYMTKSGAVFQRPGRASIRAFKLGWATSGVNNGTKSGWDTSWRTCAVPVIGGETAQYYKSVPRYNEPWAPGSFSMFGTSAEVKAYDYVGNYLGTWKPSSWTSVTP